ncbi:FCD domain-containing protein [Vibrio sp. WXL103]|uniref:FCD domain-containing protein n=1 Tax=unclassified Vibrio TaxID=2614977 RepID=UPI003EC6DBDF
MAELINKRRYFDVGTQIEGLLESGVFKVGERLPSERELSDMLDTSRATIREAIIMLELKGLVEVKQGAGIYFIDVEDQKVQPILAPKSDVGPFELLQARQVIESTIAAFAASQIKFNELQALKKILVQQEKEINGNSAKFEELDQTFHHMIAESTQNRVLINQATQMWSSVRIQNPLWRELNQKYLHEEKLKNTWIEDHKRIFVALQKRNPEEARQAVWNHIEQSRQELMKLVIAEDASPELDDLFFAQEI